MNCPPYRGAKLNHITNGFRPGHEAQDFCPIGGYGTFLVAPEDVFIIKIVDSDCISESVAPLENGYGIIMKAVNGGAYYLYWHCLPIFPVNEGAYVKQGQPVAQMGNSGFCMAGGCIVPIDIRLIPPYKGMHLHYEKYVIVGNKKIYIDPLTDIDFNLPINFDLLVATKEILTKMLWLIKGRKTT